MTKVWTVTYIYSEQDGSYHEELMGVYDSLTATAQENYGVFIQNERYPYLWQTENMEKEFKHIIRRYEAEEWEVQP